MQPGPHGVLAAANHDEAALEGFCFTMRDVALRMNKTDNGLVYEKRVAPDFLKKNGRMPKNRHEIRKAMLADSYARMSSVIRLLSQEMKFDAVGACVERQLPALVDKARAARQSNRKRGSLVLDPALAPPRYCSDVDMHQMPGGYFTELAADDVYAGAIYDRGVFIRSKGMFGPYMDEFGQSIGAWLRQTYPEFAPRRILDVGCTVGHSTLGLMDQYPDAEMQAIDVAAPVLRYAHARAESLGKAAHFSQQNGERTNFPAGHFDLVINFAMLHETSTMASQRIVQEAHRLLAPGGLALFFEAPPWSHMSVYDSWIHDWETHFNAEPFIGKLHDMDEKKLLLDAGFDASRTIDVYVPSLYNTTNVGTFGGTARTGQYWCFGAWK